MRKSSVGERRTWLGGYIRHGARGPVFVIERWVDGVHFHVSTRCKTERAALKELERFELSPTTYRSGGPVAPTSRVEVTPELIAEYERYQVDVKKTTTSHARDCARYMEDWMHVFAGRDIRAVDLHRDIKPALDAWQADARADTKNPRHNPLATGARKSRIVALKGFTAWLRREKGLLRRAEDPTLDLQVPQARPEQLRRRKAVTVEQVEAALKHLRHDCRDLIVLLAATGLHVSEVARFAKTGELIEPTPEKRAQGAIAMMAVQHKTGIRHVVALMSQDAVDAAGRIRVGGWVPSHSVLWHAMRAACGAAGVPVFNAGALRHSVATWLHEAGVPLAAISEQLGHRNPRTTADFYRYMGGQARPMPLPRLRLVTG